MAGKVANSSISVCIRANRRWPMICRIFFPLCRLFAGNPLEAVLYGLLVFPYLAINAVLIGAILARIMPVSSIGARDRERKDTGQRDLRARSVCVCVCVRACVYVFVCVWLSVCVCDMRSRGGGGGGSACVCVCGFCCCRFLIHMSIIWICVVSRVCPVGRPSCVAKTFTLDITHKLFKQISTILYSLN